MKSVSLVIENDKSFRQMYRDIHAVKNNHVDPMSDPVVKHMLKIKLP